MASAEHDPVLQLTDRPEAAATQADVIVVLGRLLSSPRGDSTDARRRIALLERMLRHGGGWWRAEDLARPDGSDLDDLRGELRELRRVGALMWDERAQAFALHEHLRVPLALTMLAAGADSQDEQLQQLDALVPFAQLAGRGEAREAPVWAMLDVLERDLRAMQLAAEDGQEALERCARERWLVRHAEDMRATVDRLEELSGERPASRALIERAVELLNEVGALLARLSLRMSRTTRDQVRLSGSRRSAAELRAAAGRLADDELAALVAPDLGLSPAPVALPDELALADALPRELVEGLDGPLERAWPGHEQLSYAVEEPPPAEPDATELAAQRLSGAPPRRLAEHLFGRLQHWDEAVRLQHGLIRIQGEAARLGRPGWQALDEAVHLGPTQPVSWLREIEREEPACATG